MGVGRDARDSAGVELDAIGLDGGAIVEKEERKHRREHDTGMNYFDKKDF